MYPNTYGKPKIEPITLAFGIFQLLFIIIAIALFAHLLKFNDRIAYNDYDNLPKIQISGLNEITPHLPKGTDQKIESELLKAVEKNTSDIDMSIAATLRKDTLTTRHFAGTDLDYFSAIIDIPSLEQSYRIFHEYNSKDKEYAPFSEDLLTITCLVPEDEIIYPNFDCEGSQMVYRNILASYISAMDFKDFSLLLDDEDLFAIKIIPHDQTPNISEQNEYISRSKSTVDSFGVPSEIFDYNIIMPETPIYDV